MEERMDEEKRRWQAALDEEVIIQSPALYQPTLMFALDFSKWESSRYEDWRPFARHQEWVHAKFSYIRTEIRADTLKYTKILLLIQPKK